MQTASVASNTGRELAGPDPKSVSQSRLAGICVVLAALVVVTYFPVLQNGFVNIDDGTYVYANPHVRTGLSWENTRWASTAFVKSMWHPLTWLSIQLDSQLFGPKASGHHLTSLLMHAASTVLLFLVLYRLTGAAWRSGLVAALFGLHPLHVESVAWASERKDVLSCLFWMLTMFMYVRYVEEAKKRQQSFASSTSGDNAGSSIGRAPTEGRPGFYYGLSLACFVLGLLSKPMVVTLPIILLLLDWWPLRRFQSGDQNSMFKTLFKLLREKAPFFVASIAAGIVAVFAQKGSGALQTTAKFPIGDRLSNAILSGTEYLAQMFWPARLAVYYPYPKHFSIALVVAAALALAAISIWVLWMARRRPYLAVGWIWYVVTVLPVIGLLQVGHQSHADRYTYLPLVGVFLLLVWGAYDLSLGWRNQTAVLSVAAALVTCLCIGLSLRQVGYWKDSEKLLRHALAVTKNNEMAHNNLGTELLRRGQLEEALSHFREGLRLVPDDPRPHHNLGTVLFKMGRVDEAIPHLEQATRLKPDYAAAQSALGMALGSKGRLDEAIPHLQIAVKLAPGDLQAHSNLALALASKQRFEEAIVEYKETVRLKPDYADALHNLGALLSIQGRHDEAIPYFQAAVKLAPNDPVTHCGLGIAFGRKGRFDEAISEFKIALRLKPNYADAETNLKAAEAGKASQPGPAGVAPKR